MKCPTCGRRPSERHVSARKWPLGTPLPGSCPNPLHDLADKAPALEARVRELETAEEAVSRRWTHPTVAEADALKTRAAELEKSKGFNTVVATKEELVARAVNVDALKKENEMLRVAFADARTASNPPLDARPTKILDGIDTLDRTLDRLETAAEDAEEHITRLEQRLEFLIDEMVVD